jgi:diaminopimelate decarboxylase
MASTYNALPRAAAVMVSEGRARLIVRRESVRDLVAREIPD